MKISKKSENNKITKVFALGGLEEVGKNTYCIEHDNEIIIIDAGLKFPEKVLLGVKAIIPDYQYLIDHQSKIKGLFITHGHEDHIGGIPHLLKKIKIPKIYSPLLASDLIKLKIKRNKKNPPIIEFNEESEFKFQHFKITFFAVSHSIPNSFGICVQTPNGTVVSTGDFKLDLTPLATKTSLHKISQIGQNKVALLLSDSTNSEIEGYTLTERKIINNIESIIQNRKKRILITTFASNFNRIFWILLVAQKAKKKVAIVGRSIQNIINITKKRKYFDINPQIFIEEEQINQLPPEQVVVICTGSQGENNSVITKIANSNHKTIQGGEKDLIIFSSKPIPGNAYEVENIINKLQKKKIEVYISSQWNQLHTSGHACQEEQKIMLTLLKPKYFMPMHGEYRMLKIHGQTAKEVGIKKENIFICKNGDQIYLKNNKAWIGHSFPVGVIFIGNKETEESMSVLNERQLMLKNGVLGIIFNIDLQKKKVLKNPQFISQGSFYFQEETIFMNKTIQELTSKMNHYLQTQSFQEKLITDQIKTVTSNLIYEKKKIHPLIYIQILYSKNDSKKKWQLNYLKN